MAEWRECDLRINEYRDASVQWRGRGSVLHLPTGASAEYEFAWNDKSQKQAVLKTLQEQVMSS